MDKLSSMVLSILFYNLGNSFHGEMSFLIFSIFPSPKFDRIFTLRYNRVKAHNI